MRFVQPETVRLDLHDGTSWIEVKRELTVGEDRRYRSAGLRRMSQPNGETSVEVDWTAMALARVEAYLVDWSATKPDGKGKEQPVPVTRAAIEALASEDFDEIDAAINAHIEAIAREKKAKTGSDLPTPLAS